MSAPDIGIVGLRETVRNLEKLGVEVGDIKAAWNRVGNIVVAEAQSRAPQVSGALAGSIRANKAKGSSTIKAGTARVPYAGVIHWGWPGRNIEATHFLTDAAADKRDEVLDAISDELDNLIRRLDLK